jgi:hypothetical protein
MKKPAFKSLLNAPGDQNKRPSKSNGCSKNGNLSTVLSSYFTAKFVHSFLIFYFMKYNSAQLEEEYGDRLLQIAQSPLGDHEEYGSTFSDTLNDIPAATEAAARAHLDLAQQIKHHLELPLSTFVKDQKEVRQAVCYNQPLSFNTISIWSTLYSIASLFLQTLSKIEDARQQKAFHISNATTVY